VLVLASSTLMHRFPLTGVAALGVSLSPTLGAAFGAWAILRALWRMDELQRRVQFDAIAIAFMGTALLTLGWTFGENAGLPILRAGFVWPIMGTLWILGLLVARLRY